MATFPCRSEMVSEKYPPSTNPRAPAVVATFPSGNAQDDRCAVFVETA